MTLPPLLRKMLAEFIGVMLFLTSIVYSQSAMVLSITLGLMALLLGGVSGGHFNPAVSLYFLARKQLGVVDFIGYVVAQLLGAVAGSSLAMFLKEQNLGGFNVGPTSGLSVDAQVAFVSEIVATAGLVLLIITLIQNKLTHLIPFGLMLWVFAAANFTPTGAQANPAVTFGLMANHSFNVSTGAALMLAQVVGVVVAMVLTMLLTSGTAKKKAAAKKK